MARTCEKHRNEVVAGTCRSCRAQFCPNCLVFPRGPSAPPLCIPCALVVGGVRASGGRAARRARTGGRDTVGVSGRVKLGVVALVGTAAAAVSAALVYA